MNSPDVAAEDLEYEFELDEPLEKVWRALIDPKIAATWMLPDEEEPPTGALTCDLVSAEPPRRVSYRWQCDDEPASYVTFELARVRTARTGLRSSGRGVALGLALDA